MSHLTHDQSKRMSLSGPIPFQWFQARIKRMTLRQYPHGGYLTRETNHSRFWVFRSEGDVLIHDAPIGSLEDAKVFAGAGAPTESML